MHDIASKATRELLVELIGETPTVALYTNALIPLFSAKEAAPPSAKGGVKRTQRKLMVARELVIRCLAEQLPREIITNPELVRTYLQAKFAPLE